MQILNYYTPCKKLHCIYVDEYNVIARYIIIALLLCTIATLDECMELWGQPYHPIVSL